MVARKVILSALAIASMLGGVACGTASSEQTGEAASATTGPSGNGIFGSDTLRDGIRSALTTLPSSCVGTLEYLGTGSGNGEKCLRGQAVTALGGTYCNGSRDQGIAPMSRPLNSCNNSDAGESNNRVALDGVGVWVKSTNGATNVAVSDLKALYCGTDGHGTTGCATTFNGAAVDLYRRDNSSGTTDVFRALVGCSSVTTEWCPGVTAIDESTGSPRFVDGSGAIPTECNSTDSATVCIGKLVAANGDGGTTQRLGYAGKEASNANNKALNVGGIAYTDANIRKLINDPTNRYPLARFLYINSASGNSKSTGETCLLNAATQNTTNARTLENSLAAQGFIRCSSITPGSPGYAPHACGTPVSGDPDFCP